MERSLYKRYGIGVVFIMLAVVCIVFGIKNAGKSEVSEPYYTTVAAVITEKYPSPAPELEAFADVTYTDLSGIERSGRIEYNGSAKVGDTIEIEMSTHNPKIIGFANSEAQQRQTEEKSQNKLYAAAEIIGGVILFVAGILLVRRKIKCERAELQSEQAACEMPKTSVPPIRETPVKEAPATVQNTPTVPEYDLEELYRKIDGMFPPKPMVKLNPKRAEGLSGLSVFESKLGGVPYMPADHEYPKGVSGVFEGRPLRLLAQLNFEKLPHIENFPMKGILQFFCSDDEEDCAYGLNFDNPISQNGFRVIYHESIITDESKLMSKESMPTFTDSLGNFPFKGEFLLEAEQPESCPISVEDHRFFEAVLKFLSEVSGKELKTLTEAEEAGFADEFWDRIYEERACEHTCIGGYPFFTQDDPRGCKEEIADHDVLLFQCTSVTEGNYEDEIMWGDVGVGNFFITQKDLQNLDFSKAAYNWDCG